MNNYVPYHLHSEDSLLDSTTNFKLYVDKAVKYQMKAICFSEHGNIFHHYKKRQYCESKGIKYIHGVEIYLTEQLEPKVRDNMHTILIAKNLKGFLELNNLISIASDEKHFYYKPRLSFDEFLNISDNIISTSACLASPLNQLDKDNPYYEKLAQKYDFYEIQPHKSQYQVIYNQYLYDLSLKYNKHLICGTDTHSLNEYKAECRSILQKAKGIVYSDEDSFDLTFKSYDELVEMFKIQNSLPENVYGQAIENTNLLNSLIESYDLDKSFKYASLYKDEDTAFQQTVTDKYLDKIKRGIIKDTEQYRNNIQEEYKVFKKLGMLSFILFMSELITWCNENNIPTGFCRGSVGGSTIAYILDIIDLNPVQWSTIFSRFANEDRVSLGDIDVDFDPRDREKVYEYIINKFSVDKTCYILAVGTMDDKRTIEEIGRALQYDLNLVKEIKDSFSANSNKAREKYQELFYYFDGMKGTQISQGCHPAGIVAGDLTLADNVGLICKDDKWISQIDMDELHDLNYVKYDILGLKNVAIIKDTCKLLNIPYPKSHKINWNDKNVWDDIITSSVGIFQFEGNYAFKLLKDFSPQKLNDLSLVNASLRPSGASYRDELIAHKFHNNPSSEIDDLLKDNYGYLVFQEDTIKFLTQICGFNGSEADNVRRAIGNKKEKELKEALPKILEGYCNYSSKPREIAEQEAMEFIQIISDSSDYQFGYNHSTGYSMIGYICGMLRYYYPLEFITAFLNNANNEEDIINGTQLAKLKNIKIEPIEFRHSKAEYTCDKSTNSIYKGIESIKFCNSIIAEELYQLRDNDYLNFMDLLQDITNKTSINSKQLEILVKLDFFKEFGKSNKLLQCIKVFNLFYSRKEILKSKIQELNINEQLIRNNGNETAKKFTKLDWEIILNELYLRIPNESIGVIDLMKTEILYLGYTNIKLDLPDSYALVTNYECPYTHPMISLYYLNSGKIQTIKCKNSCYNKNKFNVLDILNIQEIKQERKWSVLGKDENGKPKFKQLDELEWLLKKWKICKVE
jgi:DNA polymerase III subunit alpha